MTPEEIRCSFDELDENIHKHLKVALIKRYPHIFPEYTPTGEARGSDSYVDENGKLVRVDRI